MKSRFEAGKIAFATDDGVTISPHFGRARFYEVITIENGTACQQERRAKISHAGTFHDHGPTHDSHGQMLGPIRDCQLVVARGMGSGMYAHIKDANLTPLLVDCMSVQEAVQRIIEGTLVNHPEMVHQH